MRRADRLFRLVEILRSKRLATGGWLAEQLGVSLRTLYRDIADLSLSGVPIEGEAGVGYLDQSFDDPLYGSTSGLSTRVRLEYFPTQLLTLGLNADRSVGDSGVPGSGGYLSSSVQLTADYELRRNIIVEARGGFVQEDFNAIDRRNDRWIGGVRATYLLNRRLGVTAAYDFENRSSSGIDRTNDFNTHRFVLSLVAQY